MSDIAIRVDGLGKRYHLGGKQERYHTFADQLKKWTSLRRLFNRPRRGESKPPFWALKDVSFELKRGEVVGIIGRNGAGKSTLLKILSRITEPTEGEATIYGRVGSLLEVGTGFHPELTGRENIFLNGAILGMRRAEILRQFDAIVAFAEVEKFIDTPTKHYSSGMYMRLAFAVAAHLEPEILVVDEVLAVGDAQFQKKCLGKMGEIAKGGRTVLFVSHNMAAIQSLCRVGIRLESGRVEQIGPVDQVVRAYLNADRAELCGFNLRGRRGEPVNAEVTAAWLEKDGVKTATLIHGDQADIVLKIRVKEQVRFSVELILRQQDGIPVAFIPSGLALGWELAPPPGEITVRCHLPPIRFASGEYSVDLITAISGHEFLDCIESGLTFTVNSAAVGERNWSFSQGRGQGYLVWDVVFEVESEVYI